MKSKARKNEERKKTCVKDSFQPTAPIVQLSFMELALVRQESGSIFGAVLNIRLVVGRLREGCGSGRRVSKTGLDAEVWHQWLTVFPLPLLSE